MTVTRMQEEILIPTGDYPVKVISVVEQLGGKYNDQHKWTFLIIGTSEWAGTKRFAWTNISDSLKSTEAKWAIVCGLPLEAGVDFDTDDLVGKICIATIVIRKKDDGTIQNRIDDLMPMKEANGRATVRPTDEDNCADCGEPIKGFTKAGKVYSANQVAQLAKAHYGRELCLKCSVLAKDAQAAAVALEADEPDMPFVDPFSEE